MHANVIADTQTETEMTNLTFHSCKYIKICFFNMDTNIPESPFQSFKQNLTTNPLNHPITLVKGLIAYAQHDVSLTDLQTTTCRINEFKEVLDAYTVNYLTDGQSETLKNLYCLNLRNKKNAKIKLNKKLFKYHLKLLCSQTQKKSFLQMFNFDYVK